MVAALFLASRSDPLPSLPSTIVWAWDRPEDLRFVRTTSVGIAFLDRTISMDGDRLTSRPRLNYLRYNPGTPLMSVVRLESAGRGLPNPSNVIPELLEASRIKGIRALQIDFDARESERAWYRQLLVSLRQQLPSTLPLTITSLASWCEQDAWIRTLPIADATPMLFRMGPEDRAPLDDFAIPLCRSSVGLSTDEFPARIPRGRRLFFFHPAPWTPAAFQAIMAEASRWQ